MTHLFGRGCSERRLRLVSDDEEPDVDRSGVSITFAGQLAVDLLREELATRGLTAPDVMAAIACAVNALEQSAGGSLDLMFEPSDLGSYPAITVQFVTPRDPPDRPPRCG